MAYLLVLVLPELPEELELLEELDELLEDALLLEAPDPYEWLELPDSLER